MVTFNHLEMFLKIHGKLMLLEMFVCILEVKSEESLDLF